jgi:rod shape-determining protein MreC
VLSVLLLLSLTLVVANLRGGGDGLRSTGAGIFGPIENAAGAVVRPVTGFLSSISSLGSKDQQIADLKAQNAQLQQQLEATAYFRSRAQQLDALLHVAGLGQYTIVPAQVIAIGPAQGMAWTVTLDVGSRDHVKPDMSVIAGTGLAGKVVSVTATTAVVQLITDATSTVGARLEGSNRIGLLNGTGNAGSLQLQMLDQLTPVKVGDRLVKALTPNSPYVAGIPLGVVSAVAGSDGQLATVTPYVDVTALDVVGVVVVGPRTDPRDSLLPPKPSPSTSPSPSSSPSGGSGTSGGTGGASPGASPMPSATG